MPSWYLSKGSTSSLNPTHRFCLFVFIIFVVGSWRELFVAPRLVRSARAFLWLPGGWSMFPTTEPHQSLWFLRLWFGSLERPVGEETDQMVVDNRENNHGGEESRGLVEAGSDEKKIQKGGPKQCHSVGIKLTKKCFPVLFPCIDGIHTVHQNSMQEMLRHNLQQVSGKKGQRVLVTVHKVGDRIKSRDELVESTFNKEEAYVSEVSTDKETNETGKSKPLSIDIGN
jgi:hypothetical protein